MDSLYTALFILLFIVLLSITLLRIYNVFRKSEFMDWKLASFTILAYILLFSVLAAVSFLYATDITEFSELLPFILYDVGAFFLLVNFFFYIIELWLYFAFQKKQDKGILGWS